MARFRLDEVLSTGMGLGASYFVINLAAFFPTEQLFLITSTPLRRARR